MSSSAVEIEVQWQSVLAVEEGGLRVVEYFGFTEGEDEEFAGVVLVLMAGLVFVEGMFVVGGTV